MQPAKYLLRDSKPDEPPVTVRFGDLRDGFDINASKGTVQVSPCDLETDPTATLNGPGPALVGLIQGAIPLRRVAAARVNVTGDASALRRVLP